MAVVRHEGAARYKTVRLCESILYDSRLLKEGRKGGTRYMTARLFGTKTGGALQSGKC